MGYLFSKEARPLQEQLLQPTLYLLPGDLLLVASTDLEISLNSELWNHVGMIVHNHSKVYVYHDGILEAIEEYTGRHNTIEIRQLKSAAPDNLFQLVQRSAYTMLTTTVNQHDREGYAIAIVLQLLGFIDTQKITGIRPRDFSERASILPQYGEHYLLSASNY
tara:strand:- start:456 stop:944 length:489 start_codon:yes stop_codon:yes gene_type:complete